jgi:hypothetical protein
MAEINRAESKRLSVFFAILNVVALFEFNRI